MNHIDMEANRKKPSDIHKVLNGVCKLCRPDDGLRTELKIQLGLSDEIINQYILSAPPGNIVRRLQEEFGFTDDDMLGVPGFFQSEKGDVLFKYHVNVDYGIAVRSISHKISGILLHFQPIGDTCSKTPDKEVAWLSTKGELMGTPSGSPIGMVGNPSNYMYYDDILGKRRYGTEIELGKRGNIFITDSFFKATACHRQYGTRALFMTGVQNRTSLARTMGDLTHRSGSRQKVIIAPDANWRNDMDVMEGWLNVVEDIYGQCLPVWMAVWPPSCGEQIRAVMHRGLADRITPKRISKAFLPHIRRYADAEAAKGCKEAEQLGSYARYISQKLSRWENQVDFGVME